MGGDSMKYAHEKRAKKMLGVQAHEQEMDTTSYVTNITRKNENLACRAVLEEILSNPRIDDSSVSFIKMHSEKRLQWLKDNPNRSYFGVERKRINRWAMVMRIFNTTGVGPDPTKAPKKRLPPVRLKKSWSLEETMGAKVLAPPGRKP